MAYYTESRMRSLGRQILELDARRKFAALRATAAPKVFISHSSADKEFVRGFVQLLEMWGAEPYVDWLDTGLPERTSNETAHLLKQRIEASEKVVVLVTESCLNSVWVPWELGFGDAKLGPVNIAVLPVIPDYGRWEGREYLGLYLEISESHLGHPVVAPVGQPTKGVTLQRWIQM